MFESQNAYLHGTGHSLLMDRKFDTAIRRSQIEAFLDRHETDNESEDDKLLHHHFSQYTHMHKDTTLLPRIMLDILQQSQDNYTVPKVWSRTLIPLIEENLRIQQQYNLKTMIVPPNVSVTQLLQRIPLRVMRVLNILMVWASHLATLIERLPSINVYKKELRTPAARIAHRSKLNTWYDSVLGIRVVWSNHMCVVEYKGDTYLQPRPMLLQLHNKICDMISVMLTVTLQSGSSLEVGADHLVLEFLEGYHRMHLTKPTQFFNVAKVTEGYITSVIMLREEEWVNDHLYNNIVNDLYQSTGIHLGHHPLASTINRCSTPLMTELGCLVKLSGHPLIDIEAGHKKLYGRVTEEFDVSMAAVAFCISAIKKNYVCNFIVRHKRWPAVDIDPVHGHPGLRYAHRHFIDPYSQEVVRQFGAPRDEDWSFVELLPELKFIYAENILPLLKDKAISVMRTKTFGAYINDQKQRLKPKDTRLLLYYLFTSPHEETHTQYLMKYMAPGTNMDELMEYLVIRVVPKEKELKEEYRGFGCKTYHDRARSIIQELNAMRFLDLTSDEQAMTLSELQLAKKIRSYRTLRRIYPNHRIIMINFDASGWNNKFRSATVDGVMAHTLDRIYNVNLFSRTHAAYEKTLVVIPDPKHPCWWPGQLGGIEGLNQDTWVVVWLAQMKYAFRDIEYLYHLLTKGDDFRACIPVPEYMWRNVDVQQAVYDLIRRVSDAARAFGHEIKVTESYASEIVFTFSKTLYLCGITMPYTLRKVQKTYGANNAFLPVLDDYVAATFSNAHSACSAGTTVLPCYITALWWTYYYLTLHPAYKDLSPRDLIALTLTPSVMGGLPIIYLHNMFVRAESDLLSAYIGLVMYLRDVRHPVAQSMEQFLHLPVGNVSKLQLLQDPYSLPIKKPMTASNYLKRITRAVVKRKAKANDVKELFNIYTEEQAEKLVELLETSPFWPAKVFASLYANSPFHLVEELTTQFVTAKSIKDLLLVARTSPRRAQGILKNALKCDRKLHAWRIQVIGGHKRTHVRESLLSLYCPAEAAQKLRDTMWGRPITTITYPPIQHQIHLVPQPIGVQSEYARANHFLLLYDGLSSIFRGMRTDHYREGKYKPFLGQTTRTGNMTPVLRLIDTDPLASKVTTLLMLRDWTNVEANGGEVIRSNFYMLVDKMLQSFTSTPPEHLHPFTAVRKSGTSTHRLRAHGFRESIVPNTTENVYTCMQGESNTHTHMRMDPKNLTINFLHVFCYSIYMSTYDLNYNPYTVCPEQTWIVTNECAFCNTEIIEPPILLNADKMRAFQAPFLTLTKIGGPLETIIGEALQNFIARGATYVAYQLTAEELPIASEALVAEVISQHWSTARRWEQRYRLHSLAPGSVQQAEDISSFGHAIHLSENDVRAVPMDAYVVSLALVVRDFFEREMKTDDVDVIHARLSTLHDSDVPWYGIVGLIQDCGFLYPFILRLAEVTGVQAPAGALNRLSSAVRYVGRSLYTYATEFDIRTFVLIVSTLEPQATTYRRFQTLVLPMLSCHIRQLEEQGALDGDLIYDDPDELMMQYITLCCPPMTMEALITELHQSPRSRLDILDASQLTIDDLYAIENREHPRHNLVHYWLRKFGDQRREAIRCIRDMLSPEILAEWQGELIEMYIKLTTYTVNLAQCIDMCRTYPAYEEKRHYLPPSQILGEDLVEIPTVRPRATRGICVRVQRTDIPLNVHDVEDQPLGPPLLIRQNNLRFTDVYRTLGSATTSVTKFVDLLRLIGWPPPPYLTVGSIFCVGEGEGGILSGCLSMFPRCEAVYNSLIIDYRLGQLPGIALLEHGQISRLKYQTQIEGVSDLRQWATCMALSDQSRLPLIMVHCDAELPDGPERAITAQQIWINVARFFLTRAVRNSLLIIKVFLDLPHIIAIICSYLNLENMWIIRTPTSHPGPEAYIVASTPQGYNEVPLAYDTHMRYHVTHLEPVVRMQATANTNIEHHNQHRGRRFAYTCDAIFAWQNRFLPYVPVHGVHVLFESLYLRHPGTTQEYTFDEFLAFATDNMQSQLRSLRVQLAGSGAEYERNPTNRSTTLRHKVTILERYLRVTVALYLLEIKDRLDPHAWIDDPITPLHIFYNAVEGDLDNLDIQYEIQEPFLIVYAYDIDLHHLTREIFKSILRLIGLQYLDCWRV